jgi:anti-anti-sigma factor
MLHHNKLDIHQREKEGIVILDLKGHLIMGAGDIAMRDFVQSLFDSGNRKLILNLADISEIDTSGMGVLLLLAQQYHRSLARQGVRNGAPGSGGRDLSRRTGCGEQFLSGPQAPALRHPRIR